MRKKIYYYKTISDKWHFSDGLTLEGKDAAQHLWFKRKEGYWVERLYLDIPNDWEQIQTLYQTPEYWSNRTWEQEYNEE